MYTGKSLFAASALNEPPPAAPASAEQDVVLWKFFLDTGINSYRKGNLAEADDHFEIGRRLAQKSGKGNEFERSRMYRSGLVERDRGNYHLAVGLLKKALRTIKVPAVELNNDEPWRILDEVAELLCLQGKTTAAERLYKSFCTMASGSLAADHFFVRAALAKLGMLYLNEKKVTAAKKVSKHVYRRLTGSDCNRNCILDFERVDASF